MPDCDIVWEKPKMAVPWMSGTKPDSAVDTKVRTRNDRHFLPWNLGFTRTRIVRVPSIKICRRQFKYHNRNHIGWFL